MGGSHCCCDSITASYLIPREVAFQDAFRAFSMHAMLQVFGEVLYSLCTGSKINSMGLHAYTCKYMTCYLELPSFVTVWQNSQHKGVTEHMVAMYTVQETKSVEQGIIFDGVKTLFTVFAFYALPHYP